MRRSLTFAASLAWLAFLTSCSRSQYVNLAKTTTLLPRQPLTLRAPRSLQVVGDLNELCLQITPPDSINMRTLGGEWGARRSDGVLVTVGAAMLHADNSADTISAGGYRMSPGEDCLAIRPAVHDTLHPPFVAVRITASDSLRVSRITWSSLKGW